MSKGISALSNEYAMKYGMAEAFIINKLEYYIKEVLEDDRCKVDGRTYKRVSLSSWMKILPFLSKGQIERALTNLTTQNVLTTARINGHWSDRTVSYGFVDEHLFLGTFKPKSLIVDISHTQEMEILPTRTDISCGQELTIPASEKCSLYNNTIYNNNYIAEPPSSEVGKPVKKNAQEEEAIKTEFEEFWQAYPRKIGKGGAWTKYQASRKKVSHEDIMSGLQNFKQELKTKKTEEQYIAHPSTWLNQSRWEDEYSSSPQQSSSPFAQYEAFAKTANVSSVSKYS